MSQHQNGNGRDRQREPLTVATRTHPMALTTYAIVLIAGIMNVLDVIHHPSVTRVLGDDLTAVWASWQVVAGILCIAGAALATHSKDPTKGMWVEAGGLVLVILLESTWAAAMWISPNPIDPRVTTQALLLTIITGAIFTLVQILRDQWRVYQAAKEGHAADTGSLLGESDKDME